MAQHTQVVEQLGYSGEELRLAAIDVHLPPSSGESNTDTFHGCAKKRFARMFYDQTYSIISDYNVRKIKSDLISSSLMVVPKENHNTFFIDREKNNLLLGNRLKETKDKKKKKRVYIIVIVLNNVSTAYRPHDQL